MKLARKKLVSVVAESALETTLVKEIKRLGAGGYTIVAAHGEGSRGVRKGDWDQNRNILLQVLCAEETAHAIMAVLFEKYHDDYALIAYLSDVEVHRERKF